MSKTVRKSTSPHGIGARSRRARAAAPSDGRLRWLTVRGARHHNLKSIDVPIPLGRFVCVTGVSGSGKSSLVIDILREALARDLNGAMNVAPGAHERIEGLEHLDKVIDIDQKPIGRTPRSNPATYVKVFDEIRNLFARLPDAVVRGYRPGRFSFNVPAGRTGGGRCEACEGNGANKLDMEFLADLWVTCPVCGGHRFNRETLQVRYRGKNIADVLEMDVQEALEHFANIPKIDAMLRTLHEVGLDYIKLGQAAPTLSGGEAQRVKLARELVKRSTGRTLYILDEPTTGLHFEDIRRLLAVLHGFVDAGNTVVVIEHNLDVVKTADWVIDLGPEGGEAGGCVVAAGTPEELAACPASHTAGPLHDALANYRTVPSTRADRAGRSRRKQLADGRLTEVSVVGASQHNLKNITVRFPRSKMTVCSGVSGSGKSSFAMDTVYAEGQRRYVESLSAYARQFLGQAAKPKVEQIAGLSPAVSIEQKSASRSPRSTVGTVTEIHDYLRVLWSRVGEPHCPRCDVPIGTQTSDEIVERVMALPADTRLMLLAPIERGPGETYDALFARQRANGFARVRVDGQVHELSSPPRLDPRARYAVELVVDRVVIRPRQRARIAESVELALSVGNGWMAVAPLDGGVEQRFSQRRSCTQCGRSYEELTPHHFSFNNRLGWCPACEGLGTQQGASVHLIVADPRRSLRRGAIAGWQRLNDEPMLRAMVERVADHVGVSLDTPWSELPEPARQAFLYGTGAHWYEGPAGTRFQWKGFYPAIDEATRSSWQYRQKLSHLTTEVPCQRCGGGRLREDAAAVRVGGATLADIVARPLVETLAFFNGLALDARQRKIAGELLVEIRGRLQFLVDVGLTYLTLNRSGPSLSGGESQRIRLASQLGSGLTGVLYVLDEPTVGLHPRDTRRLMDALYRLRDLGNTLLMVEHDREVIGGADCVLDFGPGAGGEGGWVVAAGRPAQVKRVARSLTGRYLAGREVIPIPARRREPTDRRLRVLGARQHNLRDLDVELPLGCFVAVTGVSGSGKSSLVNDVLYRALARRIHRANLEPGGHDALEGVELIDKVINVDQSPIGQTPASNAATYTGVFDEIRTLFARLPDAKVRGYGPNRFSFNRAGGRCEACEGNGQRCIEMHFLPDVWITCETCGGTRYKAETLDIRFKGKSITDVLAMRVDEARALFAHIPRIRRMLTTLADVGLGYLPLGQAAPTLSGGEAQRVKLAAELGRPSTGKTLYILDEPTTGLHFDDLRKLLDVLGRFCDLGNTVVVIEHNLDVIKTADWVIDLGPEGGADGGWIVAEGAPEKVAAVDASHTGRALREVLERDPRAERPVHEPGRGEVTEDTALEAAEIGEARMPWEADGRGWHTRDRVGHRGEPVRWDGAALEWVVDQIESAGRKFFAPTDWTNRSTVEIKSPGSSTPWFFHARTAHPWLLDLNFRVPARAFSAAEVRRLVPLKVLDDCDELPIYGRQSRVTVRHSSPHTDDVRILVHHKGEIATRGGREFIKRACKAYERLIRRLARDVAARQPWKTNGRQWHLGQQAVPRTRPKLWSGGLIVELLGRLKRLDARIQPQWDRKVMVVVEHPAVAGPWLRLVTNHADAIRVEILAGRGRITPAMVDRVGLEVEIRPRRGGEDQVRFWLQRMAQCDVAQFDRLVRESIDSLAGDKWETP